MSTEFTFPLALCKAQWSIWLHTLEMLETAGAQCLALGSHALRDSAAETRAQTDAIARAGGWQFRATLPMNACWCSAAPHASAACAFDRPAIGPTTAAAPHVVAASASRRAVVADALRTLNAALAATPSRKKP